MKKILITGGAGTVGTAFIEKYYKSFEFYNYSRNEEQITILARLFPRVKSYMGDIQNLDLMTNVLERINPDLVIHAAALKHVNLAEKNPSKAVEINVVGSLNVIKASIRAEVPVTIGISTDKACQPENVYGYSKWMMELLFMEYHNSKTKFVCTRFANVAASNGSVIPFWLNLAEQGKALKLTDTRMNRLMFSKQAAAELIYQAYEYAQQSDHSFVLSSMMKSVSMKSLAENIMKNYGIDKDIKVIGLRPGEKLNETLISKKEIGQAFITNDNRYIVLYNDEFGKRQLREELSSLTAEFMNNNELEQLYLKNTVMS